jgi:hypothetical protein
VEKGSLPTRKGIEAINKDHIAVYNLRGLRPNARSEEQFVETSDDNGVPDNERLFRAN